MNQSGPSRADSPGQTELNIKSDPDTHQPDVQAAPSTESTTPVEPELDGQSPPPVEQLHHTLYVLCNWKPGDPVDRLSQIENAYLALSGIALSHVQQTISSNSRRANQSLTNYLDSLHMACDPASYLEWRSLVKKVWKLANERHNDKRPAYSIGRLLGAQPRAEPLRSCPAALREYGLLPSLWPQVESRAMEPFNPLFLLKRRNPSISFSDIARAFQTKIREFDYYVWNSRVSTIERSMRPAPVSPPTQRMVLYTFFEKAFLIPADQRFLTFPLTDELRATALNAVANQGPRILSITPEVNPEGEFWGHHLTPLHMQLIQETIDHLVRLTIVRAHPPFVANGQSIHQVSGSLPSVKEHFQIVLPTVEPSGGKCKVKLDNKLVDWSTESAFVVDENVRLWTRVPIDYMSIYVPKE